MEVAAAAIELVKFVKDCLDFYQEARLKTPQQHNELRLRLEIEAIVFERWCATVGVKDMINFASAHPDSWQTSDRFGSFRSCVEKELHFNSPLISALIISVLKGLTQKFAEARIRLRPGTGSVGKNDVKYPGQSSGWKLWNRKKSTGAESDEKTAHVGRIGLFGATRYLLWDKKFFLQHVNDLSSINESLVKLLDQSKQIQIVRQTNIQVLSTSGDLVLSTAENLASTQPKESIFGALAGLKQFNLCENQADESTLLAHDPLVLSQHANIRVPQYQIEDFEPSTMRLGPSRILATLNKTQVLIEWKFFSAARPLRFEQIIRLGSLVNLLNRQDINHQFHIPRCWGLVKDDKNYRIGLIFVVPLPLNAEAPQWHSLQSMILRASQRGTVPPSPTSRIACARELATAVHHLQSVHWLHKSIRSDNVIYFDSSDAPVPVNTGLNDPDASTDPEKKTTSGSHSRPINGTTVYKSSATLASLPHFYVLGLDLSRPDHPAELSETLSMSTSARRSTSENIELYSHPDSMKDEGSDKKLRYEARFDVYSFGLILLEVGLWRSLHDMRKSAMKRALDYRLQFHTEYCNRLRSTMGDIYWRATQRCLLTDFELNDVPPGTEPGIALQLAFEKQVLSELERCNI